MFVFCFFDFSHSNSISSNEKLTFFVGKFCGKFLSQYPFLSPVLRSARVVRIVRRFFFLYTQIAFSRLSKSVFWGVCVFFSSQFLAEFVCLLVLFIRRKARNSVRFLPDSHFLALPGTTTKRRFFF